MYVDINFSSFDLPIFQIPHEGRRAQKYYLEGEKNCGY